MWFKNIHIFRFLRPFTVTPDALHEALSSFAFRPCGRFDMSSTGWVPPVRGSESLVYSTEQCVIFTVQTEEKILPASVIRDFVNEKIEEIETQQVRKVRKREKDAIREDVLEDLLPRAFTRSKNLSAMINISQGLLLIDTGSRKKAEEFVTLLRKALGTLPVTSPKLQQPPAMVMTKWLSQNRSISNFELADSCELIDTSEEGAIVNCKRQDLLAEEIQGHLNAGKLVTRLALEWNEHVSFLLDEELVVRRIRFLDVVQEKVNEFHAETEIEKFNTDFAIMSSEFAALIPHLFEVFGGEDESIYELMR